MRFKVLLTISCLMFAIGNVFSQSTPKFLIISLDGINPKAWEVAHTPNIDLLIQNATYTYSGLTLAPTYNSTTWSSLLTGVWPAKHKVEQPTFTQNDYATYPHFFDYIEAAGIKTASFVSNDSIATQIPSNISHNVSFDSDDEVVAEASDYIKSNQDVGAFFVQLDQVFHEAYGEGKGFDARRAEYIKAIQYYDEQVGTVISSLAARSSYQNENWMIVLTTNHGGTIDGKIGGKSLDEISPFIFISGDFVRNREFILDILDAEKGKDNAVFLRPGINEYVKIDKTGTKLENMNDFTVELRVKPKDASSDPSIIGDKDWNSGGNPGWVLARGGSSWQFNVADQNGNRKDIDLDASKWPIEDDLWHHLVLSFDKDGDAILYTDGLESGRTPLGYGDDASIRSPYDYLALGEDGTLAYANGSNQWKGVYDEVRIFDKVLDPATIAAWKDEKNIENRHPDWDHIIAYWKFDEHEGKKVVDSSGNGYDGELVGTKRVPANGSITHVDIATTLLSHLGVDIDSDWGLDGNIVDLVIPNIVLGTDVRMETKDVAIYPNPASDRLNFHFSETLKPGNEVTVSVFNLNGEKIQFESLTTGYSDISLDVSSHNKGYYLYHIQGKTFSYKGKFVIKN
ncbi:LamG-like jellyroll fold domain-containing protein [Reichenbachiella sp. MALMAid0571]|uniref:LamG-like jellyroll fold domain-containing protein n=1 Tax=Reichenbachiella sp. MALMAid0571 TaxID=3143939 RepID=UPI0032DED3C0